MASEAQIRASFAEQAGFCTQLGAPFTALLCRTLGNRLDRTTEVGRRVLDWAGDPGPFADALALRLCGGLHFLARSGAVPALASLYAPSPLSDDETLWKALAQALGDSSLLAWLDHSPQTNEVGRSAVLMSGLLVIADRFQLPVRLYELGASAGLNLLLDAYGYDLGGLTAGDPASGVQLKPAWEGPPPPAASVVIAGRGGPISTQPTCPRKANACSLMSGPTSRSGCSGWRRPWPLPPIGHRMSIAPARRTGSRRSWRWRPSPA